MTVIQMISPVHPRRHGEHNIIFLDAIDNLGSSPQARGTHLLIRNNKQDVRFIPAGTGNTLPGEIVKPSHTVHPRRHGEHRADSILITRAFGSSPQARGTRGLRTLAALFHRFIPAGTGNTGFDENGLIGEPVHPRRHGEHTVAVSEHQQLNGSSPQARGTLRSMAS